MIEHFEAKRGGAPKPIPEGFPTITPFLLPDDVSEPLAFIENAFSGQTTYRMKSSDGFVRHAVKIGDSIIMASSGTHVCSRMPCTPHLYTADVDALYALRDG